MGMESQTNGRIYEQKEEGKELQRDGGMKGGGGREGVREYGRNFKDRG